MNVGTATVEMIAHLEIEDGTNKVDIAATKNNNIVVKGNYIEVQQ